MSTEDFYLVEKGKPVDETRVLQIEKKQGSTWAFFVRFREGVPPRRFLLGIVTRKNNRGVTVTSYRFTKQGTDIFYSRGDWQFRTRDDMYALHRELYDQIKTT